MGITQDVTKGQLIEALKDYTTDDEHFHYQMQEATAGKYMNGFCAFQVEKSHLRKQLMQIINSDDGAITVGEHTLLIR